MTSPSDLQESQSGKQGKGRKKKKKGRGGGKAQNYNGDLCVVELGWAAFVSESWGGLEPLGRYRPRGPGKERFCPTSLWLRCCFVHFCPSAKVFFLLFFSHCKKKKGRGGGEQKDKTAPLTKQQVSVWAGEAESSAKCRPTAWEIILHGGRQGDIFSFAARSLPGKQQGRGELGGFGRCPGVSGVPGECLGPGPGPRGVPRPPGDRPPPTPFPTGRGGGERSVGSQSRDQYYKAHRLAGSGNGGRIPK